MNERATIVADNSDHGAGLADGDRLIAMVRHFGLNEGPLIRQVLAKIYIAFRGASDTAHRGTAEIHAGELPGVELSLGKLGLTRNLMAVAGFAGRVVGPRLVAATGEWGSYLWRELVLGTPGYRVAGGTDEVMRNILGERVLGLPNDW